MLPGELRQFVGSVSLRVLLMKPHSLGNFAQAKYGARNEEDPWPPGLSRAAARHGNFEGGATREKFCVNVILAIVAW